MFEAEYYINKDGAVFCTLCPQACIIDREKVGLCSVRYNHEGKLYALSYQRISSKNLDPIEKKPLNRFYQGSYIYSIGSVGCNLGCPFCQNWEIAQVKDFFAGHAPQKVINDSTFSLKSEELIKIADELKDKGNIGIAYTYNEPFIWFEYLKDCVIKARAKGLKNVLVTNGYINPKPLKEVLPYIDAMNIDLKGFSNDIYLQSGAKLNPVKKTIKTVSGSKCHLEITHLVVTNLNDDISLFEQMVDWIKDNTGSETPLHISRYFPSYKYAEQPTDKEYLDKAYDIASKKLKYVYLGNV